MHRILMIALLAGGLIAVAPAQADDMNMTDTRHEFTVRKANKGKYNPAMYKNMHKKEMKAKKGMKKAKKAK